MSQSEIDRRQLPCRQQCILEGGCEECRSTLTEGPELVAQLRAGHQKSKGGNWCNRCGHIWPCLPRQAAHLLETLIGRAEEPWVSCLDCGYAGKTDPQFDNGCVACWVRSQREAEVQALNERVRQLTAQLGPE